MHINANVRCYQENTNRTLIVRTQEHTLTDKESTIYKHLRFCDQIKHMQGFYNLPDIFINEKNPPSTAMGLSDLIVGLVICILLSDWLKSLNFN